MTNQHNKPDFIVDPFGNVEDVRHLKDKDESSGNRSTSSPSPKSKVNKSLLPEKIKPYLYIVPAVAITIAFVLILSNLITHRQTTQRANDFFSEGEIFFDNEEYEKAITSYTQAIKANPDFGQAYNNRGLAYHILGNYDAALIDFNAAIKILPNSAEVYSNRGLAYLYKGDYEKAILDFEQSIKLRPDFVNAIYNRGLAYFNMGEYDQAISDFSNAIQLSPNLTPSVINSSSTSSGETTHGIVNNLKVIQFDESNVPTAYTNRGCAYLYKGDFEKALLDLTKAIELQPDLSLAYYDRAGVYYSMGVYDKAIEDYKKVVELNNDPDVTREAKAWLITLGEK